MFTTCDSMSYFFTIYRGSSIIFNTTTKRIFHFYIVESNTSCLCNYQFSVINIPFIGTIDNITIRCFSTHRNTTYFVRIVITRVRRVGCYFFFAFSYRNIIGDRFIATSAFIATNRVSVTIPARVYF